MQGNGLCVVCRLMVDKILASMDTSKSKGCRRREGLEEVAAMSDWRILCEAAVCETNPTVLKQLGTRNGRCAIPPLTGTFQRFSSTERRRLRDRRGGGHLA